MAQMSTVPAAQAIADFPGALKNPPIFSQTTATWQSGLQYQDTIDVKGPVASVEREEIQSPGQSPLGYHTKSTLKFDDNSHLVSRVLEDSLGVSTTTTCGSSEDCKARQSNIIEMTGNSPTGPSGSGGSMTRRAVL